MENTKKLFDKYVLNTYTRVGPVFVKGKGSWLWDEAGTKYLDLFPGWGVSILGHCHPRITKVISQQAGKLIHLPNNLYFKEQAQLAEEIVNSSFSSKVFFANSGAEAVEGALKFSRLYGRSNGRYEVIVMKNSFHGRTFGALSATGQGKYKVPFKPLLASFKEARFNDFSNFKKKVTSKTVGVMLELIQGEGGVNVAQQEYIKEVKLYCEKRDLLFIVDEVQTGMGRTGKLFCYQNYGIKPDIMVLSKGLGAGVPISAILVAKEISDIIGPGMHASTFGGSPLVTRVSLEAFKIIKEDKILSNVRELSIYLLRRLGDFNRKFKIIKEIRGIGLMVGIELKVKSAPIFAQALKQGLIINSTHENVLRIMPALNIKKSELDKGLNILEEILTGNRLQGVKDMIPVT
ncbi:MAG: aspartate aminotransferase family protein [Candidatus Omnitrophota bacterium]|nr:aspartate aminotransferase family protein [Candidatus Omnitrophota bacterium]